MKETKKSIQYRQTHDLIYNTMNQLMQEKDYEKITIRDICRACDISIGNFYHHYRSKDDILNEGYHTFDHFIEVNIESNQFDDDRNKLIYLFSLELDAMKENGLNFSTQYFKHQLTMENPYILDTDRYFYQESLKVLSNLVNKYQINKDPEKLLKELLRISRGTIYDWCLHKGDYDLVSECIDTLNHVLDFYMQNK